MHFFGIVQYIGPGRTFDWVEFYRGLFGTEVIPDEQRFGIMPKGKLLRAPALQAANTFMLQLIEPPLDAGLMGREYLQRIGLGVPDVLAAVEAMRTLGMEFVEMPAAHTERRGAITKSLPGQCRVRAGAQRRACVMQRRSMEQAIAPFGMDTITLAAPSKRSWTRYKTPASAR